MAEIVVRKVRALLVYEDKLNTRDLLERLALRRVRDFIKDLEIDWRLTRNIDLRLDSPDDFLHYDLIVLYNMIMPAPDGCAILDFLTANRVTVPVLYATFQNDDGPVIKAAARHGHAVRFNKISCTQGNSFAALVRSAVEPGLAVNT